MTTVESNLGADTFPRQYARTQRLTLGEPRNITVSPDGRRVVFLRSRSGSDPVNCLWILDVDTGAETLVADPRTLLADSDNLSPAERSRRERLREGASGITSYASDEEVRRVVFVLGGRLHVADVTTSQVVHYQSIDEVFDPRLDPQGSTIAFVCGRALHVVSVPTEHVGDTSSEKSRALIDPELLGETNTVSWGSADFIAAEEMGRQRGHWWSPDGSRVAVCRVDESPVATWYIADPAHPEREPTAMRYPAAGTANADVTLSVVNVDGSQRRDLIWSSRYPYLATVSWATSDELLLTLQTRDQKHTVICSANVITGSIEEVVSLTSDTWIDLFPGSPQHLSNGNIIYIAHRDGTARLVSNDSAITPVTFNVRSIISTADDIITFTGNALDHPEALSVWQWRPGDATPTPITPLDGMHSASVGGPTLVIRRTTMSQQRATITAINNDQRIDIHSFTESPLVEPRVQLRRLGARNIPAAILWPRNFDGGHPLPVLMDPYGGPHAQRVVDSFTAHCTSQWFADQGFAVIVVDGRGTPGLGTKWEQAVYRDLADVVLDDQVDALKSLQDDGLPIDLSRVGIRGWSFGGYLAALAVLRRPDVFHAAIAGAPVTDWRLYDTHYTERYLGQPDDNVDASEDPYRATSLILDAPRLTRPLLLVHGLADDNVVAAHTLQLSSALLAAGKPHEVLPLSGVSHMTPQAVVAENLLLHQLDFLRRSLQ